MRKYKNKLEKFLQTEKGRRFLNFAYSWGAAIVILGAMFKLLHFPLGNEMLFIGMITECCVFILSSFDTPVKDYNWERVFPSLATEKSREKSPLSSIKNEITQYETTSIEQPQPMPMHISEDSRKDLSDKSSEYEKQMKHLNQNISKLNEAYEIQIKSINKQINSIEQINSGLNRMKNIYDDAAPNNSIIKNETEKMASQLRELNRVYERMLNAITTDKKFNE